VESRHRRRRHHHHRHSRSPLDILGPLTAREIRAATLLTIKQVRHPGTSLLHEVSSVHYVLGACIVRSIEARRFVVPTPSEYTSQPHSSHQPPSVRRTTHPHFNAPAPAHERASHPHAPGHLSAPVSHHPPPFPEPEVPARYPPTNVSPHPPAPMGQRATTVPVPYHPNTTPSDPYHDSSPPRTAYQPPHPEMPRRSQPIAPSWSYCAFTTLVYSTVFV
jgi:hypothetical protein